MNALTNRATLRRDTFGGWLVLVALVALAGIIVEAVTRWAVAP